MKKPEHSTLNLQHPTANWSGVRLDVIPWLFRVECWLPDVFPGSTEVAS